MTAKLPILKIFIQAISLTKKRFPALLRLGAPFIFCTLVWDIYFENDFIGKLIDMTSSGTGDFAVIIGVALLIVAMILTGIMAAVGCHRVFLMNAEDVKKTKMLRYSGREARFLRWEILIGFLLIGIIIIPHIYLKPLLEEMFDDKSFYGATVDFLFYLPFYYIAARLFMVFPATAIDKRDKTLAWSWNVTKGNGWRLTLLIFILPTIVQIIINVLPEFDSIVYSISLDVLWLFISAVEIGFLSLSYSFLCQNEEGTLPPAQSSVKTPPL